MIAHVLNHPVPPLSTVKTAAYIGVRMQHESDYYLASENFVLVLLYLRLFLVIPPYTPPASMQPVGSCHFGIDCPRCSRSWLCHSCQRRTRGPQTSSAPKRRLAGHDIEQLETKEKLLRICTKNFRICLPVGFRTTGQEQSLQMASSLLNEIHDMKKQCLDNINKMTMCVALAEA
jgi:hypothetical protein